MTPASWDEQTDPQARQDPRMLKALDMVAPGTALREGVDNVVHASAGRLVRVGGPEELSFEDVVPGRPGAGEVLL